MIDLYFAVRYVVICLALCDGGSLVGWLRIVIHRSFLLWLLFVFCSAMAIRWASPFLLRLLICLAILICLSFVLSNIFVILLWFLFSCNRVLPASVDSQSTPLLNQWALCPRAKGIELEKNSIDVNDLLLDIILPRSEKCRAIISGSNCANLPKK